MATVKLIFFPNKLKKSKKTGKIPIYLRVLHKGVKAESRLNAEVDEKELLLWNERTESFEQQNNFINKRIYAMRTEFEKLQTTNNYNLSSFTSRKIIDDLLGKNNQADKQINAATYVNRFFNNHVINNKKYAYNTIKTYRKSVNHFANFIHINRLENITLKEFDYDKAQAFTTYLTSDYPPTLKKAMTEVSALSVIRKLKVIFKHAVASEEIRKNPFSDIRLNSQSPPKPKLTIEELALIYHLDLFENASLSIYRDIFLFSCFTGLS